MRFFVDQTSINAALDYLLGLRLCSWKWRGFSRGERVICGDVFGLPAAGASLL